MSDLIRREDALALAVGYWQSIGGGLPEGKSDEAIIDTAEAIADAIAAIPAATVGADDVLDAAHAYLVQQYGASPLAHPIDRARILTATTADEFDKRSRGYMPAKGAAK